MQGPVDTMLEQSHELTQTTWWQQYTEESTQTTAQTVTVYFRTLTPPAGAHAQRAAVLEQLEAAEERGVVDEYDVHVLGGEVCLCTTCQRTQPGVKTLDTVTRLARWNDGATTSTGFTEREINCSLTGEQYRTLSPPETALTVSLDNSLAGVFPCVSAGTHYDVGAFLSALLEESTDQEDADDTQQVRSSKLQID